MKIVSGSQIPTSEINSAVDAPRQLAVIFSCLVIILYSQLEFPDFREICRLKNLRGLPSSPNCGECLARSLKYLKPIETNKLQSRAWCEFFQTALTSSRKYPLKIKNDHFSPFGGGTVGKKCNSIDSVDKFARSVCKNPMPTRVI